MSTAKIMKNASYLFVGNIASKVMLAVAMMLLSDATPTAEYGLFMAALAVSAVVCYFSDAGFTQTFMREATKEKVNISELISSYLKVRLFLAIIISVLFTVFSFLMYTGDEEYQRTLLLLVVLPTMFGATFQGVGIVYFQVIERMQFTAFISILQGVTASAAILFGILFEWELWFITAMYGASSLLTGIIALILVVRHTPVHKGWNKQIVHQLFVFTINGTIIMALPHLGMIMLTGAVTEEELGSFGLAYRIPGVLYLIPGAVAAAFYPRLFSLGNEKKEQKHRTLSQFGLKLMSCLSIGVALPFIANPEFWIALMSDEQKYASAIPVLAILSFTVILQSMHYPLADYLTTRGEQWKRTTILVIGFTIALLAQSILGHTYGIVGAATASIIVEVVLLIGFTLFIKEGYKLLWKGVIFNVLAFIASYSMYIVVLTHLFPLIGLTLTVILYGLFVLLFDLQLREAAITFITKKTNYRRLHKKKP
jgi:O-antigen/teichoic acid export membrane protein